MARSAFGDRKNFEVTPHVERSATGQFEQAVAAFLGFDEGLQPCAAALGTGCSQGWSVKTVTAIHTAECEAEAHQLGRGLRAVAVFVRLGIRRRL